MVDMEKIPCCHCGCFFEPSPRNKNQVYCMKPECRRAKKAAWQRHKMATDPDYRANQKSSHQQWAKNNPFYWKSYRRKHPEKVIRNRLLQTIRNRQRCRKLHSISKMDASLIAKMDPSECNNFKAVGQFWLVPVIAKMDALKVNIYEISKPYL